MKSALSIRILPLLVLLAALAWAGPARAQSQSQSEAERLAELISRAENAARSKTAATVFDMEIRTSSFQRSYKVVVWEDSRSSTERVLVKILGPAMWRGNGTLKIGSQLKLYNPKTNHIAVVSGSMLGDSWMGSHFSNDDLVRETRLSRDYDISLDKKWNDQSPLGSATYYRVRMTPRPTAPVPWGRIEYELFNVGEIVLPVKAMYFRKVRDTKAERTMVFSDIADLAGRKVPRQMTVTEAAKPNEYTRITYKTLELDIDIPSSKFTEQALRK